LSFLLEFLFSAVACAANDKKFILHSYRQITDPQIRPSVGDSPVMGIHLGLRGPKGMVRLGDPVYVGIPKEEAPALVSPS